MQDHFPNNFIKVFLLITFLIISNTSLAQLNQKNYKILGISVEGNSSTDATTIIANTGLSVGDEIQVPGDETVSAIKRLWSLGIFKPNIEIAVDKKVQNGIFLVIRVEEFPRIDKYYVEGNDDIGDDDINLKIPFVSGQILNPQEIFKSVKEIEKLYAEDGFLNVEINPVQYEYSEADTTDDEIIVTWRNVNDLSDTYETKYDYSPDFTFDMIGRIQQRRILVYKIEENNKVEVESITFNGNEYFEDGELEGEFEETSSPKWWKFWGSNTFNEEQYEEDKDKVKDFYFENGFKDFEFNSDSLIYSEDKSKVDIVINLYEGPQYKIRNIEFEGNTIYPDNILKERIGFQKGDIYNYKKFQQNLRGNEAQTDVAALYLDNGYLTFNLVPKERRIGEDSIDIDIEITENNRFKIGEVEIEGNTKTMDKVIRRELYTIPGNYFSRSYIFRSIQQLANLQYFNVEKLYESGVDYRPVNDSTVNIIYSVEEKSSDYLNASVGYSGSWGFSGALGLTLTNFSLTDPFQMGEGQVLNFNWQFGVNNTYRTFSLGFTEPWFMDTPTSVGFDLFDTRQAYVYDLRQSGITLRLGRRLKWPDDYFYIQTFGRFRYNDVLEGRNFYAEGIARQYTLGVTLSRTDIDNPVFPSRGSKFSAAVELSGGPFLPGDVNYYKLQLNSEWYKSLFNSNRIALFTAANVGYIQEFNEDTNIDPFEFFFMGGNGLIIATTPLRGYEDRSVGPTQGTGEIVGGRVLTKYTVELRGALSLEPIPLYLLTFAEAGNVFYDLKSADFSQLRRSAGFGARILINPVGLLGFDFGYGFDRKQVDGMEPEWLFHFQFGKGL